MKIYSRFLKRTFDLSLATIVLFLTLPIFALICILQLFIYPNGPFFSQSRHTKNLRVFKLIKFRTMLDLYDNQNKLLPDHLRVTKFGKFLRRTKLDELPNLLNIISGRLSFVGPRPLPVKYSKLMSPNQLKRYVVRSGLTGLAQISKLETDNWLLKTKLDIEYINEITFIKDLVIILKTPVTLLFFKQVDNLSDTGYDEYKPKF